MLLAFSALVSAVHVPYGTFLHSAVALVPHAYLLAIVGLAAIVGWVAARRPSWEAATATRNLTLMAVGVVLVVSVAATLITIRAWDREQGARTDILAALAVRGRTGDVVMSPDAGAYRYHGGWSGIVTPDDPLPIVEEALRLLRRSVARARARPHHGRPATRPGRRGAAATGCPTRLVTVRPDEADTIAGGTGADPEASTLPAAALYAVCLADDDERCHREDHSTDWSGYRRP